ncbi:S-adenosyl-L-methionine-dependent methyltransferase [Boeremia exigua]|uniref:S-adenosyl-L-methionine-dependent methyltransferase n=1 Tax=Boeremia exigua TaxID=749465 RepID=UPI001E8EED59|nr:S-adenosyl-L-methionine-dependent methyltransferase [Boeremia exigua]KAH6639547.1 S-adenosyl-L-methionine-dependent methyltransferase [Boeremia exigua]
MATQSSSAAVDASIKSIWQQTPDVAERYKAAENATRPFAKTMVAVTEELTTLKSTPVHILDLGCGTGAIVAELYDAIPQAQWPDLHILAGDISQPMLEYLKTRGEQEGWSSLTTQNIDATKLPAADLRADFAHVFVGFAIFMLPPDVLPQLAQKTVPGGTIAVSSWVHLPWYELLGKVYAKMQDGPELPTQDELRAGMTNGRPWHQIEYVREQLQAVGLQKVDVRQEKVNVDCGTPETFSTTMGFVIVMLSKQWPEEKREEWVKGVGETMKEIVTEEAGGADKHMFMEFEAIVGVGLKGE